MQIDLESANQSLRAVHFHFLRDDRRDPVAPVKSREYRLKSGLVHILQLVSE